MELSKTVEDLELKMSKCYQSSDVDMLDHGCMVDEAYGELIAQLEGWGELFIDLPP